MLLLVSLKSITSKHFAYVTEYEVDELIYVGKIHPANFHLVTDYYQVSLKSLLQYIIHVSCEYVNKVDLSIKNIVTKHLTEIKTEWNVAALVDGVEGYYTTKFETYFLQEVEVNQNNEFHYGHILHDVFYPVNEIKGKITKKINRKKHIYNKERRTINDDVIIHLLNGWTVDKLRDNLQEMNRKKYIIIFAVFEKLQYVYEANSAYQLNEIEEFNLYYRPFINFLIKNVDMNKFYFQNNGINFSVLYYLSLLKEMNNNSLNFFIDELYVNPINLVRINVRGIIKTCFAYDNEYIVGEPVFYQTGEDSLIGFVHEVFTIPLNNLLEMIEYCQSFDVVRVMKIKEIVHERSNFNNKVILVKIYDGKESNIVISQNDIPYVGQSVNYKGKQVIVVAEPTAVDIENIELQNYNYLD